MSKSGTQQRVERKDDRQHRRLKRNAQRMKNLLKLRRWEAGMKQYELANKLHCSAPYLSLVENGRIDPPEEFKILAAKILKTDFEELFPETQGVERILDE